MPRRNHRDGSTPAPLAVDPAECVVPKTYEEVEREKFLLREQRRVRTQDRRRKRELATLKSLPHCQWPGCDKPTWAVYTEHSPLCMNHSFHLYTLVDRDVEAIPKMTVYKMNRVMEKQFDRGLEEQRLEAARNNPGWVYYLEDANTGGQTIRVHRRTRSVGKRMSWG